MARTFITIGLPVHTPFRLWLVDRVDELAAIDPKTAESINGHEVADMVGELAGLLRSDGKQFSTGAEELVVLGDHLQGIGASYQGTSDGAFAETASYMGLWLAELGTDDEE